MFGLESEMARPVLPRFPLGRPSSSVSFFQVSPPSQLWYSPEPGPPERKIQGQRR
jgi:hypothetical protein